MPSAVQGLSLIPHYFGPCVVRDFLNKAWRGFRRHQLLAKQLVRSKSDRRKERREQHARAKADVKSDRAFFPENRGRKSDQRSRAVSVLRRKTRFEYVHWRRYRRSCHTRYRTSNPMLKAAQLATVRNGTPSLYRSSAPQHLLDLFVDHKLERVARNVSQQARSKAMKKRRKPSLFLQFQHDCNCVARVPALKALLDDLFRHKQHGGRKVAARRGREMNWHADSVHRVAGASTTPKQKRFRGFVRRKVDCG
mmetsp:Transcript_9933/g.26420  ORF Transcript_9933/g.26420 Transcript_9933/m.26420 type:complete len:251 (+) Transcript_9933:908-1660(+)